MAVESEWRKFAFRQPGISFRMRRARDQSSFRAFPCVHPDKSKTTITPAHSARIRSGSRNARARAFAARISVERNVAVKGSECLVVARAFAVENGSTFYVLAYGEM